MGNREASCGHNSGAITIGDDVMKAELTATVEGGVLKPDVVLPFPDRTRVKLTIEPIESLDPHLAAWERLRRLIDEKPLVGLAGKFSRDELYERD
jgi:hypothetical protein